MSDSGAKPKPRPRRGSPRAGAVARSSARTAAVQALYQMDLAGTDLNEVIDEFVNHKLPLEEEAEDETVAEPDPTFFAEILRGVVRRQRDIDPLIDQALALGWRLVRVDSILRAILRAGVFELLERRDVPARVVINEYLDVAAGFLDPESTRFANGVLDALAHHLRPAEFGARA